MNADDAQEWADLAKERGTAEDPKTTLQRVARWRKEPPTVEDVKACAWWWNKPRNGNPPHVVCLSVADATGTIFDRADCSAFPFNYYGGEWAPAVPPPSTQTNTRPATGERTCGKCGGRVPDDDDCPRCYPR